MLGIHRRRWLLALGLAWFVGCGKSSVPPSLPETWDAMYIKGAKAGYTHTRHQQDNSAGQPGVRIEQEIRLTIQRFNDQVTIEQKLRSWETPAGQLLRFASEDHLGPTVIKASGIVKGNALELTTTTGGRTDTRQLPWSPEYGGFSAVEQSLQRQPMKPGEQRTVYMLMPTILVVAAVEMSAKQVESTELLSGPAPLLRVEQKITLPGNPPLPMVCWVDEQGNTLKSHMEAMQQDTYRVSGDVATSTGTGPLPDLGVGTFVKLAKPIDNAPGTTEVHYRVELLGGDPAKVFSTGGTQRIQSTGPNSAKITVTAINPRAEPGVDATSDAPPTDADRKASNLVQSDDPRVVQMAAEAAGDAQEPAEVAVRLERFVRNKIKDKNFTQAFATAADVAQSLEGDCTEHAVLLAAMARAEEFLRGAMGLVYVNLPEQGPAFAYHMWTEVYLDGRWVSLDGTLGLGRVGADHIKLAHSSLEGDSALANFIAVAQVMGQLKIEVLSAQ